MNLTLTVTTPGSRQGRVIPVAKSAFTIGRDPACQLRPASDLVSRRHCELRVHNGRVFVEDFQSTNGTFVNGHPVGGVSELLHGDRLRVGPLVFEVGIHADTPGPPSDDEVAALLLAADGSDPTPAADAIPTGETAPAVSRVPPARPDPAKSDADASSAAGSLLTTYRRRPR